MNTNSSFGSWLRQRRKALDLTQQDLAYQVGCAVTTIQKIERDIRRPSKQITERLADVLAISLDKRPAFVAFARRPVTNAIVPVLPVETRPAHNLPPQPTPFVGRELELAAIAEQLVDPTCRLLTLVGPGGIGKTRLALRAAAQQTADFADGVYFVSLAPVGSPDLLASAIGSVFQISFYGPENPRVQLANYLRDKAMLLVLDNFEHLLDGSDLLAELLSNAPHLRIMATSRERLNLHEEWVFHVEGLPFPTSGQMGEAETYSAIQLFVQSARRTQSGFSLADDEASVIAICRAVEGLPLGIELAATWVRTMPCHQIAQQIAHDLDFLVAPLRNVPNRHRSLRAVFDHSWNLLSVTERYVLAKLSIFHGGADLASAEQVTGASLSVLRNLVDKSWIWLGVSGRFDMHELLRQYASDKLLKSEETVTTADQHLQCFLTLAERAETHFADSQRTVWLDRLEVDLDNLRAALEWALIHERIEKGIRLASALAEFWRLRAHWTEGHKWLARLLGVSSDTSGSIRSRALSHQAQLSMFLGDNYRAEILCEESLALARQSGDKLGAAWALQRLGNIVGCLKNYSASAGLFDEALTLFRQIEHNPGTASALYQLGWALVRDGDFRRGSELNEEALALSRRIGSQETVAWALFARGNLRCNQGLDPGETEVLYQECLNLWKAMRDKYGVSRALWGLATVAQMQRDVERACLCSEESLALNREIGNAGGVAQSLDMVGIAARMQGNYERSYRLHAESLMLSNGEHRTQMAFSVGELGKLAAARQRPDQAAKLLGAAEDLYSLFSRSYPCNRAEFDHTLETLRSQLGDEAFEAAYIEGRSLTLEEAIAFALDSTAYVETE